MMALLDSCSQEDALWRPNDDDWSILEIVCHLIDEDLDDFGTRLRLLLESPESDWPKINPRAVVTERRYRERDLQTTLREFVAVRRTKIGWLRTMADADYEAAGAKIVDNAWQDADIVMKVNAMYNIHIL